MKDFNKKKVKKEARFISIVILILAGLFLFVLLNTQSSKVKSPTVENGFIDLTSFNLHNDGNIKLDGKWEFYWNQILYPGEFELDETKLTGYFKVPHYWTKYSKLDLSSKGNATYRLLLETDKLYKVLSIKTPEIYTNYSLYVNGKNIYTNTIDNSKRPKYLNPDIHTFSNDSKSIEIVLQIKNNEHFNAGIGSSLLMGTTENIYKETNKSIAIDLVLFTVCICAGLYNMILFLFRNKDYKLIFFSFICFFSGIRGLFANETYIMKIIPNISFITGSKIVHLLITMIGISIIIYTYLTYKDKIPKKLIYFPIGICFAYLSTVILLPSYVYTLFASYFSIIFFFLLLMIMYKGILKHKNFSSNDFIFISGELFIFMGLVNDIFYYNKFINTGYWFSRALVIFIIINWFMLSKEYSDVLDEKKVLYEKSIETNLSFMQAQIKPHFIYNTLSNISYLTTKEPLKAKDLILDFSDYLRNSFEFNNNQGLTLLSKEIELIKSYLAIQKERYKDRLKVEYNINTSLYEMVPRFSIQPIIENAVRHGIINKVDGGTVKLSVENIGKETKISVEDNGIGMSEEKVKLVLSDQGPGVGIRNVNNRLKLMYGKGLIIKSKINEGTKVEIIIPHSIDGKELKN